MFVKVAVANDWALAAIPVGRGRPVAGHLIITEPIVDSELEGWCREWPVE